MRYTLKHKIIGLGGDSMIKDEHGRDLIFVDGAAISLGRRLTLKDLKGGELASIHQELIAFTPTFEIHVKGGISAKISMKLLSITDRLKIDVPGPDDLEARGDLFHHEYAILRGGREVAHVSKRWIALTDSYGVEIDDHEDQILLLSCAVVIDEILEMKERGEREN
jgi:uncharacterized protein YxjI